MTVRLAVVQASPVYFDLGATVDKVCRLIGEAASEGAEIVLLPEAFIGGYPWGLRFGTAVGGRSAAGRRMWERYWNASLDLRGPEAARISAAVREAGVFAAIGAVERDTDFGGGTLFCSILYYGPDGTLLGKHRKLKPTAAERLIWGEGDGSTLTVLETPQAKVGGLICWENYMPLARMAMYAKGVEVYLAPTADARESWQATLRHIAVEGRCYVLGCNQYVTRDLYPDDVELRDEIEAWPEVLCRGGSAIYGPLGDCLAGPLYDREGILSADFDRGELVRSRFDFDAVGHYARPDIFQLTVNERPAPPVTLNAPVRSSTDDQDHDSHDVRSHRLPSEGGRAVERP